MGKTNDIPMDATKARSNFFAILDNIYKNGASYLIHKSGVPVARISELKKAHSIMSFSGIWKGSKTEDLEILIANSRKEPAKQKRHLPKLK